MRLVSVPLPASSGKPMGTKLPDLPLSGLVLNRLIPRIISSPMMKMTMEPAMAKELTSSPMSFRKPSPANKKAIISAPANRVVFSGRKCSSLLLMVMIAGTDPTTSMMANRVSDTVSILLNDRSNITVDLIRMNDDQKVRSTGAVGPQKAMRIRQGYSCMPLA